MSHGDLDSFAATRTDTFLDHYRGARAKYDAIWKLYDERMPTCIAGCKLAGERFDQPERDGPQGIYWIGSEARILFVGREHFGWYGEQDWPNGRDSIQFRPLEFAFGAAGSMSGYWSVVRQLIAACLDVDLCDWDAVLRKLALTNASKCLGDRSAHRNILNQRCQEAGYLLDEFRIVNAPLNVFFTRSLELSARLFAATGRMILHTDEFIVIKQGEQTIIECDHPGRQSRDWRGRLESLMREHIPPANGSKHGG